jgi:transposase
VSNSIDLSQPQGAAAVSTEVNLSARKKRYSAAFKLRLIEEADRCIEPGELAALLRREAIYNSTLSDFRKQKARGVLDAKRTKTTPKEKVDPKILEELAASEREVRRLRRELERTRAFLELQKKVSELLGLSLEPIE